MIYGFNFQKEKKVDRTRIFYKCILAQITLSLHLITYVNIQLPLLTFSKLTCDQS